MSMKFQNNPNSNINSATPKKQPLSLPKLQTHKPSIPNSAKSQKRSPADTVTINAPPSLRPGLSHFSPASSRAISPFLFPLAFYLTHPLPPPLFFSLSFSFSLSSSLSLENDSRTGRARRRESSLSARQTFKLLFFLLPRREHTGAAGAMFAAIMTAITTSSSVWRRGCGSRESGHLYYAPGFRGSCIFFKGKRTTCWHSALCCAWEWIRVWEAFFRMVLLLGWGRLVGVIDVLEMLCGGVGFAMRLIVMFLHFNNQ